MLVAFDFDGTLSDSEMTVLLGEQAGVADEIADITERAMNDELSYAESLRARADLLGGLPEADVVAALDRVELRSGAADVVAALRAADHRVAVLTGGFERGVERALSAAGVSVDAVVANRLPSRDGALTGDVEGPLVEGTKDDALDPSERASDDRNTIFSNTIIQSIFYSSPLRRSDLRLYSLADVVESLLDGRPC